ncbi:MAG: mannose-6-phosphate isomerase [Chloroflexales bacterium]|nr:mannose-6-phosphate isomerase [Chloroflexales bacterium]
MLHDHTLYPLLTERRIVEPIWGGARLVAWLDLPEPRPHKLGEAWQVYDSNPIYNGPLAGQTLADVTRIYGEALVGARTIACYGADFPLLAKFIDANDKLSIQVHPDDAYAHSRETHTGFHGKTEAWYILDAAPGADIIYGPTRPTSREEFAVAIQHQDLEPLLRRVPVQSGDVIFVPAGTIHAINAGIVLFEIQQKSDLTYRVYDYGRRDVRTGQMRELHLAKALDVIDYIPAPRSTLIPLPLEQGNTRLLLVACPYFALEHWQLKGERDLATDPGSFEILTIIAGVFDLGWAGEVLQLRRGDSVVLPASLGAYTLCAAKQNETDGQILRAYVPDLESDLIASLRAQGISEERIAQTINMA